MTQNPPSAEVENQGRMKQFTIATYCVVVLLLLRANSIAFGQSKLSQRKPPGKGWLRLIHKNLAGWEYEPEYWKIQIRHISRAHSGTKEHHYAYTRSNTQTLNYVDEVDRKQLRCMYPTCPDKLR